METDSVICEGLRRNNDVNMLLFIGHVQEINNLTLYEMSTVDAIMSFTAAVQETQY